MLEVNLTNRAISQTTVAFNSMCKFGDVYLGATDTGLCKICGYDDNGTEIPAMMKSGMFDLGTPNPKRFRFFYFGLQCSGDLLLKVFCDDVLAASYTVDAGAGGTREIRVPISRAHSGRYWEWKVENVDGSFFALYSVKAMPIVLGNGRG